MKLTSLINSIIYTLAIYFSSLCINFAVANQTAEQNIALEQLLLEFKDTVQSKSIKSNSIEFCPDSTCETFEAKRTVPLTSIADFAYLYLYFFSDYSILSDWRGKPESLKVAKLILKKNEYISCVFSHDIESAKCVLSRLSHDSKIKLFFVRYDEGIRTAQKKDIRVIMDSRK